MLSIVPLKPIHKSDESSKISVFKILVVRLQFILQMPVKNGYFITVCYIETVPKAIADNLRKSKATYKLIYIRILPFHIYICRICRKQPPTNSPLTHKHYTELNIYIYYMKVAKVNFLNIKLQSWTNPGFKVDGNYPAFLYIFCYTHNNFTATRVNYISIKLGIYLLHITHITPFSKHTHMCTNTYMYIY